MTNELLGLLSTPETVTAAVAKLFRGLRRDWPPDRDKLTTALNGSRLDPSEVSALAAFLFDRVASKAVDAEEAAMLAEIVLGWLNSQEKPLEEVVQRAIQFLSTEPPSRARSAAEQYLRGRGRDCPEYAALVKKALTEENYAIRSSHGPAAAATRAEPHAWCEWEEQGWGNFERDWPIAELYFEVAQEEEINRVLSKVRSPLREPREVMHYFLLHRLWRADRTTLERVKALHDRALLVFRNHWNLLPMEELTKVAAEVYAGMCAAVPESFPPLDGMDLEHLKSCWRGSEEGLQAVESQVICDLKRRY
jgi:hypothetical protein